MSTILNSIPAEAQITRIEYEGPRIALYTKNPRYLHQNNYIISEIVNTVKKRVVTRTEKSIRKPEHGRRSILDKVLPVEAGATNYFFDDATGEITVEANIPSCWPPRTVTTSPGSWSRPGGRSRSASRPTSPRAPSRRSTTP